jgi:DNA invertase Pin-like site-specific DNA recombinase
MKLIALLRVSSSIQWNKGSSCPDQLKQVQEYAEKEGYEVIETISVQVSGKKMKMNMGQLAHALQRAKEQGAEIAVSRLDRLSRSQQDLLQLKEASDTSGIDVHICSLGRTIKNISHLEFSMMAMIADNERRSIQERVKRACKDRVGPIGQELDPQKLRIAGLRKRRQLAEEWAKSIGLEKEIINAGKNLKNPTLRNVCAWLNGNGKMTRTGAAWKASTLHKQLTRFDWKLKELVAS